MTLVLLLVLPFVASAIAAALPANARNLEAWGAGVVALACLGLLASAYPQVQGGGVIEHRIPWLPRLGADLVLRLDGLGWLLGLLVTGIGLLVVLYARYYMSPQDPVPRFFAFLLAFMGSMLGIALSGNLIQLVLFWELTSLTSFLLIGYWHRRADARRGARMALTVTAAGGLCLLAGVLLIGGIVGSYDLDRVLASGELVRGSPHYLAALVLVAVGALTKSAQFPFHFWLPHAMAAPTPVSAYLHSATMVKAGVFLLMRLWPVLSGTPEWSWIIGGAGVATMLVGSFAAIFQRDLKGLLAYSTISHLGLITVLLGIGTPLGLVAGVFHMMNHATFKASLFMAAGAVDHETGTRDMQQLTGLGRVMPITATLAIVASAAMAGVPLLNGFLSKEMFFAETALVGGDEHWYLSYAALMMGTFSVAYSLRFISVFFGPPAPDLPRTPHEPPRLMRFPIEFLVLLCLIVGIFPGWSVNEVLVNSVQAVLGAATPQFNLSLWHGVNLPLVMSVVALVGGIALYVLLRLRFSLKERERTPVLHRFAGAQLFESLLLRLFSVSRWTLRQVSTERTQPQLLLVMAFFAVLPLLAAGVPSLAQVRESVSGDPLIAALWLIGSACAVAAAWTAKFHRLAALILVGGTGLVTSMTFLWLSAPDLALTQLMVETVTMVLILLGLRWLPPRREPLRGTAPARVVARRARDLLVAAAGGSVLALVTFTLLMLEPPPRIGEYFLRHALTGGGGSNAVNVLLVDFRGFDTLGEICVLSIVALTVYALLRRFRPAPDSLPLAQQLPGSPDPAARQSPRRQVSEGWLVVPAVYLRLLLPFMGLVAAYFFMRGHNLPGGGFVAGLVFSVGLIVQYLLGGTEWVESRLRIRPHGWTAAGLLLAVTTGAGSWAFGYPFLTSHTAHLELPLIGELHVPSAFFFDLGVFLAVVGTTLLMLVALAHQSIRAKPAHAHAQDAQARPPGREAH
ncbi:monovalent cation/H+ antiporter subunit A [Ramlibacter sp. AW1]|uniref:Monovalent cation/H+ antiporter subunit A n=1 Tax=Ramlibacter aurantiacus TaxID=2801330 RepID=A0A937D1L9_9BURK|nr:monovalent cation/H+ antiporter subunit A [Ramlibacter aurantiacus]MBL0420664.1 monovalent cation/H+ antiporter subunit A [Ramlibacter aurantiacus]